jgi:hypothetical protein
MRTATLSLVLFSCLVLPVYGDDAKVHPLSHDKTGVAWVYPFEKAQKQAAQQSRLLIIKPIAFGTSPDGCW